MSELEKHIALLVEGYQWDSGNAELEAHLIAGAILALPKIAEALEFYENRAEYLGEAVADALRDREERG